MSYDKIWLCPSLQRSEWTELTTRSQLLASSEGHLTEGTIQHELEKYQDPNLNSWKFAVTLSAGRNVAFDEAYLFLKLEDARRFFTGRPLAAGEQGYQAREFIDEGEPIGFDSVALWVNGSQVAERS